MDRLLVAGTILPKVNPEQGVTGHGSHGQPGLVRAVEPAGDTPGTTAVPRRLPDAREPGGAALDIGTGLEGREEAGPSVHRLWYLRVPVVVCRERPPRLVLKHGQLLHRRTGREALEFGRAGLDAIHDWVPILQPGRLALACRLVHVDVLFLIGAVGKVLYY